MGMMHIKQEGGYLDMKGEHTLDSTAIRLFHKSGIWFWNLQEE